MTGGISQPTAVSGPLIPEPVVSTVPDSAALSSAEIVPVPAGWLAPGGSGDPDGSTGLVVGVGADGDASPVGVACPPPPGVDPPGGGDSSGPAVGVRLGQVCNNPSAFTAVSLVANKAMAKRTTWTIAWIRLRRYRTGTSRPQTHANSILLQSCWLKLCHQNNGLHVHGYR